MLGALPTYQAKGIGRVEGAMSSFQLVQEMGSEFAAMYFPGVLQLDGHKRWCCRGGRKCRRISRCGASSWLRSPGAVMGVDGAPETRAYVQLTAASVGDWFSGLGSSTDSKGEFSIKGVPPGTYYINTSPSTL